MTENNSTTIVLARDDESARALIRHERSTSKIRYAEYVSAHGVTLETVPAHVQALATLAGEVKVWESPAARKAFCTKVRNGLKHHLTPESDESDESTEVDYLARVLKAVEAAVEHGVERADILKAITA